MIKYLRNVTDFIGNYRMTEYLSKFTSFMMLSKYVGRSATLKDSSFKRTIIDNIFLFNVKLINVYYSFELICPPIVFSFFKRHVWCNVKTQKSCYNISILL